MNRFIDKRVFGSIICDRNEKSNIIHLAIVFLNGSSLENKSINGVTHLIEHMLFKGTKTFSQKELALQIESLGGYANAYTTKDFSCFFIKMIKDNFKKLSSILSEICFYPKFNEKEFLKEKDVIISEINSIKDDPEEHLLEIAEKSIFKDSSYGMPITGTVETLGKIDFQTMTRYYNTNYKEKEYFVAISGNFTEEDLEHLDKILPKYPNIVRKNEELSFHKIDKDFNLNYEQKYLSYFFPLENKAFKDIYAYFLISCMLSEMMSSRLFQRLREDLGLCYNISSDITCYIPGGYLSIFAVTEKSKKAEFDKYLREELLNIATYGFESNEIVAAKNQLLLNIRSTFESVSGRFEMSIRQYIFKSRLVDKNEIEEKILSYNIDYINSIFNKMLSDGFSKCFL